MKSTIITISVVAAIFSGVSFASGTVAKEKTSNAVTMRAQAIEAALDAAK